MPGDDWQKLANLRLLFGYMYTLAGKKLLFMGGEFGQRREWDHDASLDWHLLTDPRHAGIQRWVHDLNRLYREERALHEGDCAPWGFEWIDAGDAEQGVLSFIRRAEQPDDQLVVVCHFTPVPRANYRVGVPRAGRWRELLNSDATLYGGGDHGNIGGVDSVPVPSHGHYQSLTLVLPPLSTLVFKAEGGGSGGAG
jgi:1,4-alpha-glucan branching enzyme